MIVQIIEHFHDHEVETYFVDTDQLDTENPIDAMVLKKAKNKAFNQEVHINVRERQEQEPESSFWAAPAEEGYCRRLRKKRGIVPEKVIRLVLDFDC